VRKSGKTRKKKHLDENKQGGVREVIKIVEIELDNCVKCAQVKGRMIQLVENNFGIVFITLNAREFSREFFTENNLTTAPVLMVYKDNKFLGFITIGFTPRRLKIQLEEMTGMRIE